MKMKEHVSRKSKIIAAILVIALAFIIRHLFFVDSEQLYVKNGTSSQVQLLEVIANEAPIYRESEKKSTLILDSKDSVFLRFTAEEENKLVILFVSGADLTNKKTYECKFPGNRNSCIAEISIGTQGISCLPCTEISN